MLQVRVSHLRCPLGPLTLVEGARGILMLELRRLSSAEVADRLETMTGETAQIEVANGTPSKAQRELTEYFAGSRRHFTARVDLGWLEGFRRQALEELARVPFGKLVTYGELASRIGRPGASRAIGRAMAQNPIPILIPCHRVVAAGGKLGGFSGGLNVKRKLHALEGCTLT
jgi:methylated-DNA-[protein]-cysteine S-methyltransferase